MPRVTAELVEEKSGAPAGEAGGTEPRWYRLRTMLGLAAPYLVYLLLAIAITGRLWIHRDLRLSSANAADHEQFLWFLADAAYSVVHGHNPLLTDQMNVPGQVNLMANTSVLGLGIPLTPVTLLFGPEASFVLALVLSLAGTASAWYWLLSRHVVDSRLAAFIGAGFCGFAPGMVAQAGGHPNLTALFLVPLIIWRVVRLRDPGRAVRNGVILGLLVTYQVFLNEEVLLLTAVACAILVAVYVLAYRREVLARARPFLAGMGITAATAGVLLAYPLWVQFFGPGHYRGLPPGVDRYITDLASYPAFARRTLVGSAAAADKVTMSANEEASFLGWPLLLFMIVAAVLMWRRTLVKALIANGLIFAALSLGPAITIHGHKTHIPGPLGVLRHIPPFELATATRYAMAVVAIVGVLLALACAALLRWAGPDWRRRVAAGGLVLAVLLPIAPKPLTVTERPVPAFILGGEWRKYVDRDHTLVSVPVPRNDRMEGMRWAALTNIGFAIPRGYFMGPKSPTDASSVWDPPPRPTSTMLAWVAWTGKIPPLTDLNRRQAVEDLRYWRAAVVVVVPVEKHAPELITAVTALLGPGTYDAAGGVWLWDVRSLTGS